MSLEVINQQGAQVVALQNEAASMRAVIAVLAAATDQTTFTPDEIAAARPVSWRQDDEGNLILAPTD